LLGIVTQNWRLDVILMCARGLFTKVTLNKIWSFQYLYFGILTGISRSYFTLLKSAELLLCLVYAKGIVELQQKYPFTPLDLNAPRFFVSIAFERQSIRAIASLSLANVGGYWWERLLNSSLFASLLITAWLPSEKLCQVHACFELVLCTIIWSYHRESHDSVEELLSSKKGPLIGQ